VSLLVFLLECSCCYMVHHSRTAGTLSAILALCYQWMHHGYGKHITLHQTSQRCTTYGTEASTQAHSCLFADAVLADSSPALHWPAVEALQQALKLTAIPLPPHC
jgi:hypothetical protein